jgi:hypothetical protein
VGAGDRDLAENPQTARVLMWRRTTGPVVFVASGGLVFPGAAVAIALTG